MTDQQWNRLLKIIDGDSLARLPVGFLVDGPWVAGINNFALLDYFTDSRAWLDANLNALQQFPDVLWLPGFWAEFGMITNPPSFGTKCIWPTDGFPSCDPVLRGVHDVPSLKKPDVQTDGLLPFIIRRLKQNQATIEEAGHRIRFATSHGPLTIASYLLGHTEFFILLRTHPEPIHQLLQIVTQFVVDWLQYQKRSFPSIDGVLVMEDFMGFVGERDFRQFVLPYMTEIFRALDVSVRFLHNDAFGLITARHLEAMRVNLFNFSFEHDWNQMRALVGDKITLMGNIPPRDVLALGTCENISESVTALVRSVGDKRRMIASAGGFTPGQFTRAKIEAFCRAAEGNRQCKED